jgi:plasmid stabilization system protein ParE
MRIQWTENTIRHLVNIYEYIGLNSPRYAKRVVDKITRRSEQIATHPLSGRKVPEYDAEDIRELIEKP